MLSCPARRAQAVTGRCLSCAPALLVPPDDADVGGHDLQPRCLRLDEHLGHTFGV